MSNSTLDITEARNQFSKLDERLLKEQVIYVTRHNKRVMAVVNIEYLQAVLETIEIVSDPDGFKMFQKGLDDIRKGRTTDHDDLKRELGIE